MCVGQPIKKIEELGDGVFSQKMMGDGFFWRSTEKQLTIRAFEKAKVSMIFPTKHAITLRMKDVEIMIHYGLDTVVESGSGIECNLKMGQVVNKGDTLLVIDNEYYQEREYDTAVIYVFTNLEDLKYHMEILDEETGEVKINQHK